MKNFWKLLSILCLLCTVAVCVASCGGDNTPSQSSTNPSTPPSSSTESSVVDSGNNDNGSNDNENKEPQVVEYTVKAVDGFGKKLEASAVVDLYKNGTFIGNFPVRQATGAAVFKQEAGEYTFELKTMDGSDFYYDKKACILSAENNEVTISLYEYASAEEYVSIRVYDEDLMEDVDYDAPCLKEGAVYATINAPGMSYFIFTPTREGKYKVSCEATGNKEVYIGDYGQTHFINGSADNTSFDWTAAEGSVQIGNQGGTTHVIIGVRAVDNMKGCIIKIEHISDNAKELDWTYVQVDKNATKQDNYVNSEFIAFDITDATQKAVFNENDGYYHLNSADGPILYVRLTPATDTDTSYTTLPSLISIDNAGGNNLCKYFYDEDGNLVKREYYNNMILEYGELCGTKGLYPLNEQLATAIKNIGENRGWFDSQKDIAFGENASKVVDENAWLLYCVYENKKALGTSDKPAPIAPSKEDSIETFALLTGNGGEAVLRTLIDATLTIRDAQNIKVIAADGTEYVADADGKISCVILGNQNFTIVYEGEESEYVVLFTFVEYFA